MVQICAPRRHQLPIDELPGSFDLQLPIPMNFMAHADRSHSRCLLGATVSCTEHCGLPTSSSGLFG